MLRLLAIGLIALVGCTNETLTLEPDPVAPADGPKLFRTHCAECHGESGEGNALGPQIQSPVDDYATYVTRNGRGIEMVEFGAEMPAYPKAMISDDELEAILAFLDTAPKPTTGQELYGRYCANCHGVDANGGRSDESLAGGDNDDGSHEIVREGNDLSAYASARKYMPAWSSLELTDQDVTLIDAYLRTLPSTGDDDDDDDDDDDLL